MGAKPSSKANGGNRRAGLILFGILAVGALALVGLSALAANQMDEAAAPGNGAAGPNQAGDVNIAASGEAQASGSESAQEGAAGGAAESGPADGFLAAIQALLAQLAAAIQ